MTEKEGEKKVEDKKEAAAAPEKETVLISVDTAIVKNVAQIDEVTATVKAYAKNDIAPQTPGRIVKIFTEVGNFVSKGQVLAKRGTVLDEQLWMHLTPYDNFIFFF